MALLTGAMVLSTIVIVAIIGTIGWYNRDILSVWLTDKNADLWYWKQARDLPTCIDDSVMTLDIGHQVDENRNLTLVIVMIQPRLRMPSDEFDIVFDADNQVVFGCLQQGRWNTVTLVLIDIYEVKTIDDGIHYIGVPNAVLRMRGDFIASLDMNQSAIDQVLAGADAGIVLIFNGWMLPDNMEYPVGADIDEAITRYNTLLDEFRR